MNVNEPAKKADSIILLEWAIAIAMTLFAAGLHVGLLFHAGALWRDEVNTVAVASLPTVSDVWNNLQFDSFPMAWLLVLRTWINTGLAGDFALRILGCCVGLGIILILWIHARTAKRGVPMIALALLGFSGNFLVIGDSLRAYGFGVALFLVASIAIWKVIESPCRKTLIFGAIAAVTSVHVLYYNAVLLFAVCCGGTVVAIYRRWWNRAGMVLGIGSLAALSMVPYLGTIKRAREWNALVQIPDYDFELFCRKFSESVGSHMVLLWLVLFVVAIAVAVRCLFVTHDSKMMSQKNVALFWLVALIVGPVGYFIFLKKLSYPTQPWYYVSLMALVAIGVEAILAISTTRRTRIARAALVITLATLLATPAWHRSQERRTNIDLIAQYLEKNAAPNDFIVITLWYRGPTFTRYYHGTTAWETIPPLPFKNFHRYDLVRDWMTTSDQTAPVAPLLKSMKTALESGHRVWMVGSLTFPESGKKANVLPPAPRSSAGWSEEAYTVSWSQQIGSFLENNIGGFEIVKLYTDLTVSSLEAPPLVQITGANPSAATSK